MGDVAPYGWVPRSAGQLAGSRLQVFVALASRADAEGNVVAGPTALARDCGLHRATVHNALNDLVAGGWIDRLAGGVARGAWLVPVPGKPWHGREL